MHSLQGCIGEAIFITECLVRNIPVYQPVADIYGVDMITGHDLKKIQVKTCSKIDDRYKSSTSYKVQCRRGAACVAYDNEFDYMAAYLIPIDTWYIIPIKELNKTTIRVNPSSEKCKFHKYKKAWHLINNSPERESLRD